MSYPMRLLVVLLTFFLARPVGAEDKPLAKPVDTRRAALVQAGYTHVPFALDPRALNLSVEGAVGAEKVKFALASGSQETYLDLKLAKRLKLELGAEAASAGTGGVLSSRPTQVPGLIIGPYDTRKDWPKVDALAADLSVYSGGAGGALGMGVLDPLAAVIDYPARTLYLRPPLATGKKPLADPLRDLLLKDGYTAVRMDRDSDSTRMAAARVGRHDLRLQVNTGVTISMFDTAGLSTWGAERRGGAVGEGSSGKIRTEMVSFRGLTLGGYDTRRAWGVVDGGSWDMAGLNQFFTAQKRQPIQGLLGNLDLLNGSAVIDFGSNTLYLRPARVTLGSELEGKWVGVRYEFDGRKGKYKAGDGTVEFKGNRVRFTTREGTAESGFRLRDEGGHYRLGLFDPEADELADGFSYSSVGLLSLDDGILSLVMQHGRKEPLAFETQFAAPAGSGLLLVEYERAK